MKPQPPVLAGLALSRHVWSWNVTEIQRKHWSESDQAAIRHQLDRILNSGPFHQSHRRQRFLEYLVTETLAGRGERLKGYNIALEVFDRPETFDPTVDPLVRIEAARLREKLREYYGTDGQDDLIHIDLPKGTYTPQIEFRVRSASAAVAASPAAEAPPLLDKPSIAVLAFTNMSGDPDQEYFSDGITEDIITELSRFHEFAVIARNSSFRYKGQSPKIEDMARELGVKYVVEGSVRKVGNRVRVSVQLIDAASAAHIWAERYDRGLDDIFAIQDEVTEAVVARIAEGITGARALHARSRPLHSATAYDFVLQARPYRTSYTAAASTTAVSRLSQARDVDPNLDLAQASLAFVLTGEFEEGWAHDPDAELVEALAAAKRACALDGADGYAHASLAYVLLKFGKFDEAEREIGVALSLNPNHVNIIMTSGWVSIVNCDPERAIEMIKRDRRLHPFMGGWELWTLGQAYLDAKRYQDALDSFAKVTDPPTGMFLERAICHAYLGQEDEARGNLRKYLEHAREEFSSFPAEDPVAWRAFFLRYHTRRRREVTNHFIEGARKAGLNVA